MPHDAIGFTNRASTASSTSPPTFSNRIDAVRGLPPWGHPCSQTSPPCSRRTRRTPSSGNRGGNFPSPPAMEAAPPARGNCRTDAAEPLAAARELSTVSALRGPMIRVPPYQPVTPGMPSGQEGGTCVWWSILRSVVRAPYLPARTCDLVAGLELGIVSDSTTSPSRNCSGWREFVSSGRAITGSGCARALLVGFRPAEVVDSGFGLGAETSRICRFCRKARRRSGPRCRGFRLRAMSSRSRAVQHAAERAQLAAAAGCMKLTLPSTVTTPMPWPDCARPSRARQCHRDTAMRDARRVRWPSASGMRTSLAPSAALVGKLHAERIDKRAFDGGVLVLLGHSHGHTS